MIAGAFSSTSGKADSVLTTKGDLATYSTTRIREAVGTNNKTLMADSAQATGIKWADSSTSTLTTAGDLLVASGANTLSRLARGSDNYILKMNGTSLNWEAETESGKLELIEHYEEASATNDAKTFTFDADLTDDYGCVFLLASYFGLNGELFVTINNVSTGVYAQGGFGMGGNRTDSGENELSINHDTTVGDTKTSCLSIYGNSADGRLNGFWTEQASLTSFESGGFYMGSQQSGTISSIEVTTSANTWAQGSTFDVYGWKI